MSSNDEDKIQVSFSDGGNLEKGEIPNRFELLLSEANRFCDAVGLHQNLMLEIYQADTDWAFILKIDALLESAVKEIIKNSLKLKVLDRFVGDDALADFVDSLPVNGRTSLLQLLKASGCPMEDTSFIEVVRQVRNGYAHNIKLADFPLIEVIKSRKDKSRIIKHMSNIENYQEEDLINTYENDGGFLRFGIVDATMRILLYAYHLALKPVPEKR